jgi:virginiamycin B lyase
MTQWLNMTRLYKFSESFKYSQMDCVFFICAIVLVAMLSFALVEHQNVFAQAKPTMQEWPVKNGSYPHDVAPDPAKDGPVWFTSEFTGELGKLDPTTGNVTYIQLGKKCLAEEPGCPPSNSTSFPHGVILDADGAPWVTDAGLHAMVRVDPKTEEVKVYPLPENITKKFKRSQLNTPTIDKDGMVWFTGRAGFYGKLNPETEEYKIWLAPRGPGPYGINTAPDGIVYFNSWTGNYTGRVDPKTDNLTILEPPTPNQMVRRVWSDSQSNIWVSEWAEKNLAAYFPSNSSWKEWRVPGDTPVPYGVFVDEKDKVWLTDWDETNGTQTVFRFDPTNEKFESFPLPSAHSDIHQMNGRAGEVWAAEPGVHKILVIRTGE